MHRLLLFCLTIATYHAASVSHQVAADLIVRWDLTGNDGAELGQPVTENGQNIVGMPITYGPGVTPTPVNNSFTAQGWETVQASDPALDTDYFAFGFTVDPGFEVTLETLYISTRSLAVKNGSVFEYGPKELGLYYSGDGYAMPLETFVHTSTSGVEHAVDLSQLTGLSGDVEFRIIQIGNDAVVGSGGTLAGGRFRIYDHSFEDDIRITGSTVAAVPEASAWLGGSLVCFLVGTNCALKRLRQGKPFCR